ncbi:ABC-type transport system involved in cytochrome bd biosynthesis fused ATPase/permease subunit [Variovorax boronicumulans]|uniref:ABC-type transport system involved in cytochrome bd biosynthesis fused ATPase/permease subunit n=1 Tax=Variovorax boronicumulans TaxID=436515 RepID=A0AAW8DUR4_9BURK|nr:ABC transporter ATP-binding protein [Variovorax boronicumulans]MDP9877800.1 ABC-type transport system involved in cytochrome bd biosynthesis fused ATPase/permease subunit [Variovorax boronicumulans]MDP9923084.1 ABC-type transport system involved in cytochrome bd biosynthesis fused ATPase/permease subunit [Variovorax boronicumulans]
MSFATYWSAYKIAYRAVKKSYHKFHRDFLAVTTMFVLVAAISALPPYLIRIATNQLGLDASGANIVVLAVCGFAVAWTISAVLENVKGAFSAALLARADAALYSSSLKNILSHSTSEQQRISAGELWPIISRAINSFAAITISIFWTILPFVFEIGFTVYFISQSLDSRLSAAFALSIAVLTYVSYVVARKSSGLHLRLFRAENDLQQDFVERHRMLFDIKINQAESREVQQQAARLDTYVRTITSVNNEMAIRLGLQAVAFGIALLAFALAAVLTSTGSVSRAGDFVMTATYLSLVTSRLRLLAASLIDLERSLTGLVQGVKYFVSPSSPVSNPINARTEVVFEVRDLKLSRAEGPTLGFQILQGSTVVISGRSGIGKSTLVTMMLGLQEPKSGQLHFSGEPVTSASSEAILASVAVAPQLPRIFSGTLRENLLLGATQDTDDAFLMGIINELELGNLRSEGIDSVLDARIGIQGHDLSGGEQQRISIGRALARRKQILLIDEPTTGLDDRLVKKVLLCIRSRCETLIMVSHDHRVLQMADQVIDVSEHTDQAEQREAA